MSSRDNNLQHLAYLVKEYDDHVLKEKCPICKSAQWWDELCNRAQDLREEIQYIRSLIALMGGE